MGADSTLTVSRRAIIAKIQSELERASNDDLSHALYGLWGAERCYNFIVVDGKPTDEINEAEDDTFLLRY